MVPDERLFPESIYFFWCGNLKKMVFLCVVLAGSVYNDDGE